MMSERFKVFHLLAIAMVALAVLLSACTAPQRTPEERDADFYNAMMRAGDKSLGRGDFNSAAALYKRAHDSDPNRPEALIGLGKAMAMGGAPLQSATAFRKALVVDADNPDALRGLGNALIAQDQAEMAIKEFERVLKAHPKDYRAYNGLGVAYDTIAEHSKAQEYYYAGLEISPGEVSLRNNLGLSLAFAGHYKGAIEILLPLATRPGASPRDRQNLALAYGLAGDTANAERYARMDMGREMVQRNLNYYSALRKMTDPVLRVKAVRRGYIESRKPEAPNPQRPSSSAATGR